MLSGAERRMLGNRAKRRKTVPGLALRARIVLRFAGNSHRSLRWPGPHSRQDDRLFNPEQLAHRGAHRVHPLPGSAYEVGTDPGDRRSQPWKCV